MPTEGQSPLVQKKAESVHVETDRNPLVFPFKTTQSLPFALRPADEPHFFCLKRRKPGYQRWNQQKTVDFSARNDDKATICIETSRTIALHLPKTTLRQAAQQNI